MLLSLTNSWVDFMQAFVKRTANIFSEEVNAAHLVWTAEIFHANIYDIVYGREFKESRKIWKAVMVKLKQAVKGSVQRKVAISKLDMAKIQASAELDQSTPKGVDW